MWKALVGLALATALLVSSVVLYPMRYRLFRPDVGRVGGTRVVLKLEGDADPDAVADVLRRRFDPNDGEGIVVRADGARVEVDVPKGRTHDENLDRVKRLAGRPGRLRLLLLANAHEDVEVVAAARAWLTPDNRKALEDAFDAKQPLPPMPGRFKVKGVTGPEVRYEWMAADTTRASVTHGALGMSGGMREAFPITHDYVSPKSGSVTFLLARPVADEKGVSNANVARPRVQATGRGRYSTRIVITLDPEGRRRLIALADELASSARGVRQLALAVDGDVLFYFEVYAPLRDTTLVPVVDSTEEGEEWASLIRAPLPAGARLTLEGTEALPGR